MIVRGWEGDDYSGDGSVSYDDVYGDGDGYNDFTEITVLMTLVR